MKKILLLALLAGCAPDTPATGDAPAAPPHTPPAEVASLVGEYALGPDTLTVLERDGELWLLPWGGEESRLVLDAGALFVVEGDGGRVRFTERDGTRVLSLDGVEHPRIELGGVGGEPFRITPLKGIQELEAEALAASPPVEEGDFRDPDLVELVALDPTIRLDIRYASTNNFMGEVFYSEPRAFLQRPAAEALVRAHQWLGERGYGLLIHDGSRHNRGCAVDLTLYWLDTGEPVEMPGGYDEFSPRSYPDYRGGTSRQRWHRELLRQAMEAQGFAVYEAEWWHFDHADWRSYRIGNQRFDAIG